MYVIVRVTITESVHSMYCCVEVNIVNETFRINPKALIVDRVFCH